MGKIKGGINGRITGKVGNSVFSSWGDIEIIKARPRKRTKKATKGEQDNRIGFGIKQEWLTPLKPFLQLGFNNDNPRKKGMTAALSYMCAHAVSGKGSDTNIDPSLMKVSLGTLPSAANVQAVLQDGEVHFSWDTNVGAEQSLYDEVLLLAYNVAKKQASMRLRGIFRKDGSAGLSLVNAKPGEYHLYLAFVAEDRSRQSDSIYLGSVSK